MNEKAIRENLERMLRATDDINNPDEDPVPIQETILGCWEKLAVLTGNRDLAEENGFEITGPFPAAEAKAPSVVEWTEMQRSQPIIPLHRLQDPIHAMGVAMFHAGSATLQYGLIQDHPGSESGGCSNLERYCWAENDARIAHTVLRRVYLQLAGAHPCGPEIRKHCRKANVWLTRERSLAAQSLGIHPPPEASDDLYYRELDGTYGE